MASDPPPSPSAASVAASEDEYVRLKVCIFVLLFRRCVLVAFEHLRRLSPLTHYHIHIHFCFVVPKLELASTRAATDTARIQARQLISQRDALREDAAKNRAEAEEHKLILKETKDSNEKLKSQIKTAEEEKDDLLNRIKEKKSGS